MGGKLKRVSQDSVVEAPLVLELIMKKVLQDEKNWNQTKRAEKEVTVEDGNSAPNKVENVIDWIVDHSN